jgi:hypothetical protein
MTYDFLVYGDGSQGCDRTLLMPVPVTLSYALKIAGQGCEFSFIYATIRQIYLRICSVTARSFSLSTCAFYHRTVQAARQAPPADLHFCAIAL